MNSSFCKKGKRRKLFNMPTNYDNYMADNADDFFGRRINPEPNPKPEIGIDLENQLIYDFDSVDSSRIDAASINSLTSVSQRRDELYSLIDSMSEDTMLAAALEIYVEDVTEKSDKGRIVWAESDDPLIQKYVNFLLDSLNVDKNIYKWVYCLCKYGDVYLKLFKEDDVEDPIFKDKDKVRLDEAIKIHTSNDDEKFVFYTEMVPNPAQMFELTRFGKTVGYIETPLNYTSAQFQNKDNFLYAAQLLHYTFNQRDVKIYPATHFVHASLEDDITRAPEQVSLILDDPEDYKDNEYIDPKTGLRKTNYSSSASSGSGTGSVNYSVKRGQSVLYDVFKTWRQLSLLENSILLNRLTKSSITRIVNVEVGDMPKEKVQDVMHRVKTTIEQKSAINTALSMQEYTNAGPYENNVYMPSYNGKGQITTTMIGGDTDTNVNGLSDVDYFKTKLYSGLKIPKQYLGDTDDAAGFNGGTSLSIVSSRYAKTVIRIQSVMIQMLTDLINILLFDRDFTNYINKFDLKMTPPTTQEQLNRQEQRSSQVALTRDIMDLVADIEDPAQKLKILKSLLSGLAIDSDILSVIQEEIDKLEQPEEEVIEDSSESDDMSFGDDDSLDININTSPNQEFASSFEEQNPIQDLVDSSSTESSEMSTELPNMADLGVDFTDNT